MRCSCRALLCARGGRGELGAPAVPAPSPALRAAGPGLPLPPPGPPARCGSSAQSSAPKVKSLWACGEPAPRRFSQAESPCQPGQRGAVTAAPPSLPLGWRFGVLPDRSRYSCQPLPAVASRASTHVPAAVPSPHVCDVLSKLRLTVHTCVLKYIFYN